MLETEFSPQNNKNQEGATYLIENDTSIVCITEGINFCSGEFTGQNTMQEIKTRSKYTSLDNSPNRV